MLAFVATIAGQGQNLSDLMAKAAQGDREAMFQAGLACEEGRGTKQDFLRALELYRPAARAGHAAAQARLARLFQLGLGIDRDDAQALFWFHQAANQGQRDAQYELGLLYSTGDGVERDLAEALKWIQLAARGGHEGATDLEKTLTESAEKELVTRAATLAAGFKPAPARAVKPEEEPDPAARAREEAQRAQAIAEVTRRAEAGDANAQVALGKSLHWGNGMAQDEAASVKWFRKAAEAGHADGQFCLGIAYFEGHGIARDVVQAYRWTLIAASQGHEQAEINLGYVLAAITNEQLAEARALAAPDAARWAEAAARAWNPKAQFNFARFLLAGFGRPPDAVHACKWLIISAGEGNEAAAKLLAELRSKVSPEVESEARQLARIEVHRRVRERAFAGEAGAQATLGRMFEEGVVEARNPAAAWAWYTLATEQGGAAAGRRLADLEARLDAATKARAKDWLTELRKQLKPASANP